MRNPNPNSHLIGAAVLFQLMCNKEPYRKPKGKSVLFKATAVIYRMTARHRIVRSHEKLFSVILMFVGA